MCNLFVALERKISVRANRDELVQKGILLPESPTTTLSIAGKFRKFLYYHIITMKVGWCPFGIGFMGFN